MSYVSAAPNRNFKIDVTSSMELWIGAVEGQAVKKAIARCHSGAHQQQQAHQHTLHCITLLLLDPFYRAPLLQLLSHNPAGPHLESLAVDPFHLPHSNSNTATAIMADWAAQADSAERPRYVPPHVRSGGPPPPMPVGGMGPGVPMGGPPGGMPYGGGYGGPPRGGPMGPPPPMGGYGGGGYGGPRGGGRGGYGGYGGGPRGGYAGGRGGGRHQWPGDR